MNNDKRLATALLFQRLAIFLVMFMWTVDKFMRPEHASSVFANFYFIEGWVVSPSISSEDWNCCFWAPSWPG